MKKYEYSVLNIYSGEWYITRSNNYYEKEHLFEGEYACKECEVHFENCHSVRLY